MSLESSAKPPDTDPPESRLDRVVRLALTSGRMRVELDALRAENDRLRATCEQACVVLSRLPEMYEHLVMDTPEDQALHARVLQTSLDAIAAVRKAISSEPDGA